MTTLHEWLADPDGAALLRRALSPDSRLLTDKHRTAIIGNVPISTLAALPNLGLNQDIVDELLRGLAPETD
jgi:hypothetical protein